MNKTQFEDFISRGRLDQNGKPVFMTSGELKALNDLCRSEILTLRGGKASAVKPAAPAPPAATPAVKPATVAATSTLTAEAVRASQAKPTLPRAEFEKLSHPERNQFIRDGGKLSV
jgi:hypothetical protein